MKGWEICWLHYILNQKFILLSDMVEEARIYVDINVQLPVATTDLGILQQDINHCMVPLLSSKGVLVCVCVVCVCV